MKVKVVDKGKAGALKELADAMGTSLDGPLLRIPENHGVGFMKGYAWDSGMRLLIQNYYLKEDILLERIRQSAENFIIFSFNDVFDPAEEAEEVVPQYHHPTALVFSQTVSSVLTIPSHTYVRGVNIALTQEYLQRLIGHLDHPIVNKVLQKDEHYAFESIITPSMMAVAEAMLRTDISPDLQHFLFRLKCEEMLCYLFSKLIEREEPVRKMHLNDIKAIYRIKDYLKTHLHEPPAVSRLAKEAGMSEPKLRKLFKQTFNKSVYDYYQSLRMEEAVRLLRKEGLTVSEAGYRLGFTNLSHFGRVFKEHTGMKPKKWGLQSSTH